MKNQLVSPIDFTLARSCTTHAHTFKIAHIWKLKSNQNKVKEKSLSEQKQNYEIQNNENGEKIPKFFFVGLNYAP